MVDPVGPKANIERLTPVAPVSAVPAAQASVETANAVPTAPTTLQALSQSMSASPPVDVDRVARIKKAIQDGNFPLIPSTIADRLLALKLEWKPSEQA